mmetsp:Transcript_45786/g.41001  ORF Transcript_45786/g.41001 Transcript_45786/m.41001 type:complete len:142 (+) Transcript_45786:45-470(+)
MAHVNINVKVNMQKKIDMKPFEGNRLHSKPGNGAIYLVLDGKLRHIPDPPTFNQLFDKWEYENMNDILLQQLVKGDPLPQGSHLFNGTAPHVYLLDKINGKLVKRHIVSPPVFNKYSFSGSKIKSIPNISVQAIPDGPAIQ